MAATLQELSDRFEIRQLAETWASACDRRDSARMASVFTPDGTFMKCAAEPDGLRIAMTWQGHNEIAGIAEGLKRWAATTHFVGQQSVDLADTTARGETYCLAFHIYETDNTWFNRVLSIRYLDDFVRVDDRWLINERRLVTDWIEYRSLGERSIGPSWAVEQDASSYYLAH